MQIKANRRPTSHALQNSVFETLAHIAAPRRLLGAWSLHPDPSNSKGGSLRLSWSLNVGREKRAIEELRGMSDHELADIGLSRSDLTLEGLAIAGSKRALRQEAVAAEIARSTKKLGEDQHEN